MSNNFRIADTKYIDQQGWSYAYLLKRLIALDYRTIPHLKTKTEGTLNQWVRVFSKSPYTCRFLMDSKNNISGYWHFVALSPSAYKQAKTGRLSDSKITPSKVLTLRENHTYNIYRVVTTEKHRLRHTKASHMLTGSFFKVLEDLAERKIFVKEMCSNAFTQDGINYDRSIGMRYVTDSADGGKIFSRMIYPFSKRDPLMRYPKLIRLYTKRFRS